MTAPEPSRGRGLEPATRGVLVLAVVVVLGLILLAKAAPSSSTTTATRDRPGTTTTTTSGPRATTTRPPSTPSTTGSARPASQVKVLVLNGTGGKIPKAAGASSFKLKGKGYDTLEPGNAVAQPASAVYFKSGYQPDAVDVAKALGLPETVAVPLPTPPPVSNTDQANVVVLLGQDAPA